MPLSQSYLLATGRYPLPSDEVSAFIWIPITEECPRGQALQNIATVSWKLNRRYCEIGFLLEKEVGKGEELISGPRKPWRSWGPPHLEAGVASHKSWYVTSLLHQEAHAVCGPSMSHSHNLSVLLIAVSSCSLHGAGKATDTGETSPPSTKKPTVISRHCGRRGISLLCTFKDFIYSLLGHSHIGERQQIPTVALRVQSSKWRKQFQVPPSAVSHTQVSWVGCSTHRIRLQSAPCTGTQLASEFLCCRIPSHWGELASSPQRLKETRNLSGRRENVFGKQLVEVM